MCMRTATSKWPSPPFLSASPYPPLSSAAVPQRCRVIHKQSQFQFEHCMFKTCFNCKTFCRMRLHINNDIADNKNKLFESTQEQQRQQQNCHLIT